MSKEFRRLILTLGYDQPDRCRSIESSMPRWEQTQAVITQGCYAGNMCERWVETAHRSTDLWVGAVC